MTSMQALVSQTGLALRLAFRNPMGLLYGFLFPLIFLAAFWALYRYEEVPLALHIGELLTVTVLGGACFGLATTLVSERELGVWRRYRATPTPTWVFVTAILISRYLLIAAAALLQLLVAFAVGMPVPTDPAGLFVAFTFVTIAFLGVGLVIALLADNVPAVQALGQCIFLPMLMIGGVAVRLSALPDWALHVSAFLPGRYAVAVIQSCVTGGGLGDRGFDLFALLTIGLAGFIAGVSLFRWEPSGRRERRTNLIGAGVAVSGWVLVGLLAHAQGRVAAPVTVLEDVGSVSDYVAPRVATARQDAPSDVVAPEAGAVVSEPPPRVAAPERGAADPAPALAARPAPTSWREVTPADFDQVAFDRLPSDDGLVAPVARDGQEPDPAAVDQLERVRAALPGWPPGRVADPVQRVRNLLYVAAVPDLLQMGEIERFLPAIVLERLSAEFSQDELARILFWIATHPLEGEDSAIGQLETAGLPGVSGPTRAVRGRAMLYAFKMLGRLTGQLPARPDTPASDAPAPR